MHRNFILDVKFAVETKKFIFSGVVFRPGSKLPTTLKKRNMPGLLSTIKNIDEESTTRSCYVQEDGEELLFFENRILGIQVFG